MTFELIFLRLVHVLGGIFWVGSVLFNAVFLIPALAASGADAGRVMSALKARRMMTYLPAVAILTILSGLRLLWITSGGFATSYIHSPRGMAFSIAGTSAAIAFLCAMFVVRPTGERLAVLGASLSSSMGDKRDWLEREMTSLRRRSAISNAVAMTLLMIGAGGMAVARYLP